MRPVTLVLVLAAGCSGQPPIAESSPPIVNGTTVSTNWPQADLQVRIAYTDGDQDSCSGAVFLQDNNQDAWVLTAAHCVAGHAAAAIEVLGEGGSGPADRAYPHPSFNPNTNAADLGLLHIPWTPTPGTNGLAWQHTFFEQRLMAGTPNIGTTLDCYGWGKSTAAPGSATLDDLKLRDAYLQVSALTYYGYALNFNYAGQLTTLGDSGGPCYWTSGGVTYQSGIHSYSDTDYYTHYTTRSYDLGVSSYAGWIEQTVGSSIVDYGYSDKLRAHADVNGDGVLDYCRIVGSWPNIFLACQLGMWNGSYNGQPLYYHSDPYSFHSITPIDPGYSGTAYMADVNGDGRADFCRLVGSPSFVACDYATATGFDSNQYSSP